jgi:maltose alpha-D-glucosyltransferase/alpha-amylase
MQWSPDGGFSTASELRRPMVSGSFGPARVNVATQRRDPDSLLNWFERLIRRRRECPELGFGTLTLLETGAPSVLAHRCDWEGATVVAVHELAGKPVTVALPVEDGDELVDLFGHAEHALPATLNLEPYAAHWYRIRRPGVRLPP